MRGKVLRDTSRGNGLLIAEGRQFQFTLEDQWGGDSAPAVNQTVDMAFDAEGRLTRVMPVDSSQLATERTRKAMLIAKSEGGRWFTQATTKLDRGAAVGALLLLLGTTFFSFFSVRLMGAHAVDLSFYDLLGFINGGNIQMALMGRGSGVGVYGILWAAAVFGPLLPSLWRARRAKWMFFMPMALWLGALLGGTVSLQRAMNTGRELAGFIGGPSARSLGNDMAMGVWNNTTLGVGFYLSLAVAIYFTVRGVAALRS